MRKRNKTITIRVTEDEWCAIMERVLKAGMNVTDYLVTAATSAQIYVAEDTKPLIMELKRIGNNLNQITAKINAGAFSSYNFYEVIEMQRAIYEEVRRIVEECYKQAKAIIQDHMAVLNKSAELLLEKEKLTREEFEALFDEVENA